jgi:prefoldin subunit 5
MIKKTNKRELRQRIDALSKKRDQIDDSINKFDTSIMAVESAIADLPKGYPQRNVLRKVEKTLTIAQQKMEADVELLDVRIGKLYDRLEDL